MTADTVTAADLDLVDRLVRDATPGPWVVRYEREGRGVSQPDHEGSDRFILEEGANGTREDVEFAVLARTLLPRLARALRAAIGDPESYAYQQGHARGRREAIESSAAYLRDRRDLCVEKLRTETDDGEIEALDLCREVLDAAAEGIERHEADRGSK